MDAPHGSVRAAPDGRFAPTRAAAPRASHDGRNGLRSIDADAIDDTRDADWRSLATFAAGLALGALVGAGAALLMAPASGFETRMRLARGARRVGHRAADRIEAVGDNVRDTARRGRRKLRRKMTVSRWRAEDAWERHRYPTGERD